MVPRGVEEHFVTHATPCHDGHGLIIFIGRGATIGGGAQAQDIICVVWTIANIETQYSRDFYVVELNY